MKELPEGLKESIIVPVYKKCDCINYRGISLLSTTQNFMQHSAVKFNSIFRGNYWGLSVWIST